MNEVKNNLVFEPWIPLIFLTFLLFDSKFASNPYKKETKKAVNQLQQWYNPETGLWETTGWWNSANALTTLARYARITGTDQFNRIFSNTYEHGVHRVIKSDDKHPEVVLDQFINDYYDDEAWWALGWIEVFDVTGESRHLETAKIIFDDLTNGWDERCNGGIYWKKGKLYKSSVSNELFMLLGTRLAAHMTDPGQKAYFLQWSLKEWNWFHDSGVISDIWLVHDGISDQCMVVGPHYTYNQGIILAALAELYKLTDDRQYLEIAEKIADATIQNLTTPQGILKEINEPDLGADGVQFKGIFIRHLAFLYRVTGLERYRVFIQKNANSIIHNAKNGKTWELGGLWYGPFDRADAGRQTAAIDALVSAYEVTK